ncbi:SAM-dependent methyltransferase [Paenibacillus larvae]
MTKPSQSNPSLEGSRWITTSNRGYSQYAQEEIRRLFPGIKTQILVPAEILLVMIGEERSVVPKILREQEPIFLRHIQPVDLEIAIDGLLGKDSIHKQLIQGLMDHFIFREGERIAVQIRKASGQTILNPGESKTIIQEEVIRRWGIRPVVREADQILSIYATGESLFVGLSYPDDNLSDWSGGAIRYRKEEGQISRAQFKLLEAEQTFGLDFTNYSRALDIGAAPGGWTSLLLDRGLEVTAIDPGDLHPSLKRDPRLTFYRKNAAEVKLGREEFDLLVCDMSWSPKQMAKLVNELLDALQTGGTAIITVKLLHKKPFQTIKEVMKQLEPVLQLQKAKQLFHNREELTLFCLKTSESSSVLLAAGCGSGKYKDGTYEGTGRGASSDVR